MRIGIDASRANTINRTGTEWYSFFIIRELIRLDPLNHYVLYLKEPLVDDLRDLEARAEVRVLKWPPRFLWSLIRLSWEMTFRPPDVLFVPAHTIPLIHPKRTVTTCHDVGFERYPELYATKPIGPRHRLVSSLIGLVVRLLTLGRYSNTELDYHRFSMRWAIRTAARILTVSNFSAREISHFYHYPLEKINIIPISYNPDYGRSLPAEFIDNVLYKADIVRPYLLFVGRWEAKKNINLILGAFESLIQADLNHQLVLVGRPGWGFDQAWQRLEPATKSKIRLLTPQTVDSLRALMSRADIFLFPSAYEGFGIPVLEAMASGVPVIASNQASLPEVCADAAWLIDPSQPASLVEAIKILATDQMIKNRQIERGYERIKAFSWERAASITLRQLTNWQGCQ